MLDVVLDVCNNIVIVLAGGVVSIEGRIKG